MMLGALVMLVLCEGCTPPTAAVTAPTPYYEPGPQIYRAKPIVTPKAERDIQRTLDNLHHLEDVIRQPPMDERAQER